MKNVKWIILIVVLVVSGVGCFFVGSASERNLLRLEVVTAERSTVTVMSFYVTVANLGMWHFDFRRTRLSMYMGGRLVGDYDPSYNPWNEFQLGAYESKSIQSTIWITTGPSGAQISTLEIRLQGECRFGFTGWHAFSLVNTFRP